MSVGEDINGQADSQEDIMLCSADMCVCVCVCTQSTLPDFFVFAYSSHLHVSHHQANFNIKQR